MIMRAQNYPWCTNTIVKPVMLQINQSFPNIMTGVGPFDPNVEPSERISLSLDQSILWVQTGDWEVTADESNDSLRFCRPWCFFLNLILIIKYYFAFKTWLKISDQKLPNFAECIAGKGKFCGRKLRKKLRGQNICKWSIRCKANSQGEKIGTLWTTLQMVQNWERF